MIHVRYRLLTLGLTGCRAISLTNKAPNLTALSSAPVTRSFTHVGRPYQRSIVLRS